MKKIFSRVSLMDMPLVAGYLASLAENHKVFAFYGPMGSGKTTLIGKIVCSLLGRELDVTSPTFALVNVYEAKKPVYHFDCYRIEKPEEVLNAGLEEMLYSNAVCLVEWPEKIESVLPQNIITVTLSTPDDESYRYIEINIPDHD
ncbi:MAG TPA: tRNA (adenosine(37)-N6)-threonylcarbamoyltransferase complex ATPase subunit type 1 TsaE [Bacteroidales bacterium]|nr:tRNA (adenosine(37)-N6)-threonylcarbamoyltransferase complex ATPase subunit type 1 TsaE [Bacteroidales bacterium]